MFGLCNFNIFFKLIRRALVKIFIIKQHSICVNVTRDGHIFNQFFKTKNLAKNKNAVNIHETSRIY